LALDRVSNLSQEIDMLRVYKRKMGELDVLCLQGRLVTGEAGTLREAVLSGVNAKALVLDFARVSRIDAGGLGLLLELRQHALSKGMTFSLANVPKLVQQILEMTCLDSVFEMSSRTAAMGVHGQLQRALETAPCS